MTAPGKAASEWVTTVIQENGRDLLSYFIRRVSDPSEAADLLGTLFVVMWRRSDSLPTDLERARKWCFGIARNALREHRRGQARQIALASALRAHLEVAVQSHTIDPAHTVEQREEGVRLRAAISRLDSRSQDLVMLVHWDDFSIADAAEHLGMNPSSARTRYSRACAKLALWLGDEVRFGPRDRVSDERTSRKLLSVNQHSNS